LRFDFNSERRVNCLSDDVKAEEHPNILLHLAPFDHDENYNPLQSFATYALSPNVFAVQCCRKKTWNNSSTSDKNSASYSKKVLPRFLWATGELYWKLLPM